MPSSTVSIMFPVFNGERYVERAIESVLSQTYENLELVVSDNCSTDGTFELLQKYARQDSRVKLSRNDRNIGALLNYRKVIEDCSGDYIELFGHDDFFEPTCIGKLAGCLDEYPNVVLATATRNWIDADGEILRVFRPVEESKVIPGEEAIFRALETLENWIGSPVMYRSRFKGTGIDSRICLFGDLDYWCKMLACGDLYYLDEVLFNARIHKKSDTVHLTRDMVFALDLVRLMDKYGKYFSKIEKSPENLRKRIAQKLVDCTEGVIYYHGDNFDHLLEPIPVDWTKDDMTESAARDLDLHDYRRAACYALMHATDSDRGRRVEQACFAEEKSAMLSTIDTLQEMTTRLSGEIEALKSSTSWKITVPLRAAKKMLKC